MEHVVVDHIYHMENRIKALKKDLKTIDRMIEDLLGLECLFVGDDCGNTFLEHKDVFIARKELVYIKYNLQKLLEALEK